MQSAPGYPDTTTTPLQDYRNYRGASQHVGIQKAGKAVGWPPLALPLSVSLPGAVRCGGVCGRVAFFIRAPAGRGSCIVLVRPFFRLDSGGGGVVPLSIALVYIK